MYLDPNKNITSGYIKEILTKFFNTGGSTLRVIVIPGLFVKKLNQLYCFLYRNKISVVALTSWIFDFAIGCFYELLENGKITSFIHLLKIQKAVKNSLKAYVEISMEQYGFFQSIYLKYFLTEMKRRKLTIDQMIEFATFFNNNNKFYLSDKVVYGIDDINLMFDKWSGSRKKYA